MKITWDERKRTLNREKHGLDFHDMLDFDWDNCRFEETSPSAHGHARVLVIGPMRDITVAAIVAFLGSEAVAIISMLPANAKERLRYAWSRSTQH